MERNMGIEPRLWFFLGLLAVIIVLFYRLLAP